MVLKCVVFLLRCFAFFNVVIIVITVAGRSTATPKALNEFLSEQDGAADDFEAIMGGVK
jgi:hypothetical protein